MAGISTKGIYGLAAMFELGSNFGKSHIQIKEIASSLGIPQNYLEQLLATLRKAGLVESIRGAGGGYRLPKPPSDINCREILEALEGSICQVDNPLKNEALQLFWKESGEKMRHIYDITLKELCAYSERASESLIYYI